MLTVHKTKNRKKSGTMFFFKSNIWPKLYIQNKKQERKALDF